MSSHDEYSSDEEDLFENQSKVTLGFTDVAFEEEDDEPTIEDTFIGGQPIWLHPDSTPKQEDLKCGNCNKYMALLLQAFAPFPDQSYDRVLYILACKDSIRCSRMKGSVKAIRGVCKNPEKMAEIEQESAKQAQELLDAKLKLEDKKKLHIELTKDLFDATKPSGENKNPFGGNPFGGNPFGGNPFGKASDDTSNQASNPFASAKSDSTDDSTKDSTKDTTKYTSNDTKAMAQKQTYASVSNTKAQNAQDSEKPLKKTNIKLPEFPGFFVFTDVETFKKITVEPELDKYKDLIEKSDAGNGKKERSMSGSSGTLNPETSKIANMLDDKYFENFSSTVIHNPSQVLRYDLGGTPLLYSGKDDVARAFTSSSIPDPAYNPSSSRQFELQLMPKTIMDLEQNSYNSAADILSGMSWGTIVVATDVQDYMPTLDENYVGYVTEYCGVQWEESV